MACCSDASDMRASSAQGPSMHVNYTKGMVLGVDDFTQEFLYLSSRDQWIVRELVGYGTISGLAVYAEDTKDGPRLRVARGSAAVPSGKLVCIPADQCGVLNAWLAKKENADKVTRLIHGGVPLFSPPMPPAGPVTIALYLTLCYADCLTAPVPIPGEPCRSEDSLMAPSRVADYFRLELRTEAPLQTEEDALRDFVEWLRRVPVVETSPPLPADEATWSAGLRAAAKPWFDALNASPPLSPPATFASLHDYMFDSPPTTLVIPRGRLADFLRVAFRFWATELRPFWMGYLCGAVPGADADCLLLARVDVPIIWVGGSPAGVWEVAGNAVTIRIDEGRRPYLIHTRLLQEWLLAGEDDTGTMVAPSPSPQALAPSSRPTFAGLTTTGAVQIALTTTGANLTLDTTHHCVICTAGVTLTLPKCGFATHGRVYVVKATAGNCTVNRTATDTVSGGPALAMPNGASFTLISDGVSAWHVIASST